MTTNPYNVWDTRKSLGVMRDIIPAFTYWLGLGYSRSINSTDEWIDFEKLPAAGRKLAPFVRPLAAGKAIYEDRSSGYRFKPAYVKLKDVIDPLMPLVKRPGIDRSMIQESELTPNQRRELIRTAMTVQHLQAIDRRREWLAAKATIDGKVTIAGEDYPAVELDFRRANDHTVVKLVGTRWGDAGVSIFDDIQRYSDRMFNAPFGGFPTRMTIGTKVWSVMRKDEEFMKHMDTNIRDPRAKVERGVIAADKVVKVGELMVGGASGATIDIYLYRDTYINESGIETPFMEPTDIVLTASDERIMGYVCHGAIIDPYANYQALDVFPRNWMETGDPAVEYILHQSAPLIVPVNPNATLKATVVA